MSENTTTTVTEEIEETETFDISEYFAEQNSPYRVIKGVNNILKDLGIDKELPGPMGYTYCKKGYIATIDANKKVVTREAAVEWAEKYITKLTTKSVKVEEPTVEDKYVGFENEE